MSTRPWRLDLPDLTAVAWLAQAIAAALRPGDVVALSGGLGAGKTTLARAILAALGHDGEVPSPSFAILELYQPPGGRLPVVHADFYRLTDPADVVELGLDELREGAALIAEWSEQAGGFGHEAGCLTVRLEVAADNGQERRYAIVEPGEDWLMREGWTGL